MSDSKKQSIKLSGDGNKLKQDVTTVNQSANEIRNEYNTYITNDPNAIDPTEREILLRKVTEFERCLADFKKALQPPQTSGTTP